MATSLRNGTITAGGAAQVALAERFGRSKVIVSAQTANIWVNFGQAAAPDVGELVYQGSSSAFSVDNYPEVSGYLSIYGTTTGDKFQIREV